jgi:ribosomal protein L29
MGEGVGRAWKVSELRQKSNEDLHKLWYILLKERNMLATMMIEAERAKKVFPSPQRMGMVRATMARILSVVGERDRALTEVCDGVRWCVLVCGGVCWCVGVCVCTCDSVLAYVGIEDGIRLRESASLCRQLSQNDARRPKRRLQQSPKRQSKRSAMPRRSCGRRWKAPGAQRL